jgi:hypothetical protein
MGSGSLCVVAITNEWQEEAVQDRRIGDTFESGEWLFDVMPCKIAFEGFGLRLDNDE